MNEYDISTLNSADVIDRYAHLWVENALTGRGCSSDAAEEPWRESPTLLVSHMHDKHGGGVGGAGAPGHRATDY